MPQSRTHSWAICLCCYYFSWESGYLFVISALVKFISLRMTMVAPKMSFLIRLNDFLHSLREFFYGGSSCGFINTFNALFYCCQVIISEFKSFTFHRVMKITSIIMFLRTLQCDVSLRRKKVLLKVFSSLILQFLYFFKIEFFLSFSEWIERWKTWAEAKWKFRDGNWRQWNRWRWSKHKVKLSNLWQW